MHNKTRPSVFFLTISCILLLQNSFVAAQSGTFPINKGVMQSPLNAGGYAITNLPAPLITSAAANKSYVDMATNSVYTNISAVIATFGTMAYQNSNTVNITGTLAGNGAGITNIQTNNVVGLGAALVGTTNGYGTIVYQNSNTVSLAGTFIGQGAGLTNIQTNNVLGLGSYINLLAYPLTSNPSNYVLASSIGTIAGQNSNAVNISGTLAGNGAGITNLAGTNIVGLGSMSYQNSNNVNLIGGYISNVNFNSGFFAGESVDGYIPVTTNSCFYLGYLNRNGGVNISGQGAMFRGSINNGNLAVTGVGALFSGYAVGNTKFTSVSGPGAHYIGYSEGTVGSVIVSGVGAVGIGRTRLFQNFVVSGNGAFGQASGYSQYGEGDLIVSGTGAWGVGDIVVSSNTHSYVFGYNLASRVDNSMRVALLDADNVRSVGGIIQNLSGQGIASHNQTENYFVSNNSLVSWYGVIYNVNSYATNPGGYMLGASTYNAEKYVGTAAGILGYFEAANPNGEGAIRAEGVGSLIQGFSPAGYDMDASLVASGLGSRILYASGGNTTTAITNSGYGAVAIAFNNGAYTPTLNNVGRPVFNSFGNGHVAIFQIEIDQTNTVNSSDFSGRGGLSVGTRIANTNTYSVVLGSNLASRADNSLRVNRLDPDKIYIQGEVGSMNGIYMTNASVFMQQYNYGAGTINFANNHGRSMFVSVLRNSPANVVIPNSNGGMFLGQLEDVTFTGAGNYPLIYGSMANSAKINYASPGNMFLGFASQAVGGSGVSLENTASTAIGYFESSSITNSGTASVTRGLFYAASATARGASENSGYAYGTRRVASGIGSITMGHSSNFVYSPYGMFATGDGTLVAGIIRGETVSNLASGAGAWAVGTGVSATNDLSYVFGSNLASRVNNSVRANTVDADNIFMFPGSAAPLSTTSLSKAFTYYNKTGSQDANVTNYHGFIFYKNETTVSTSSIIVSNAFLFGGAYAKQNGNITLTGNGAVAMGSFGHNATFVSTGEGAFFAGRGPNVSGANVTMSGIGSVVLGCQTSATASGDGSMSIGYSPGVAPVYSGRGSGGIGYIRSDNTGGGASITASGDGAIIHGFAWKVNATNSITLSGAGSQAIGFHQAGSGIIGSGIDLSSTGAVSIGAVTGYVQVTGFGAGSWGDGNKATNSYAVAIGQGLSTRANNSLRANIVDANELRVGQNSAGITNIQVVTGEAIIPALASGADTNFTYTAIGAKIGDAIAPATPTNFVKGVIYTYIATNDAVVLNVYNTTALTLSVTTNTIKAEIIGR